MGIRIINNGSGYDNGAHDAHKPQLTCSHAYLHSRLLSLSHTPTVEQRKLIAHHLVKYVGNF